METLETLSLVCCLSLVALVAIAGLIVSTVVRNFKRRLPREFHTYQRRPWSEVLGRRYR